MYEDGRPLKVPSEGHTGNQALRSVKCQPFPECSWSRLGFRGRGAGQMLGTPGGWDPGTCTVPTCGGAPWGGPE